MSATGIRVTMFFQDDNYGISEAHVYNGASDVVAAQPAALKLIKLRSKVMGFTTKPVGCRLSLVGAFRNSIVLDAADLAGLAVTSMTWNLGAANSVQNDADQAKSCALMRLQCGPTVRKSMYLAGIPDVVIRENPRGPDVTDYPAWNTAFAAYTNYLISGVWGINARSGSVGALAPRAVVGVASNPGSGNLVITISNAGAAYVVGQRVQLRLFQRANVAFASANGLWQVGVVTPNALTATVSYELFNSGAVQPSTITVLGTVQGVDYSFTPYTSVQLIGQTTRKRGNRFLAPLGRRRVRKPLPI